MAIGRPLRVMQEPTVAVAKYKPALCLFFVVRARPRIDEDAADAAVRIILPPKRFAAERRIPIERVADVVPVHAVGARPLSAHATTEASSIAGRHVTPLGHIARSEERRV